MSLENFFSLGLKAQRAVDAAVKRAEQALGAPKSPAVPTSLAAESSAAVNKGAGPVRGPRSTKRGIEVPLQDVLAAIAESQDKAWLRKLIADADNPLAVRVAAERRLKVLRRPV